MSTKPWADLWRELVTSNPMGTPDGDRKMVERWRRLARQLEEGRGGSDSSLDFVVDEVVTGSSVIDIGAGVGRWTVPLATRAARVTAIEPQPDMRQLLEERLRARSIDNVTVLGVPWLDAALEPHDVAVAAHSMYGSADLLGFVRKMEQHARERCYLVFRVPASDGIIGELSQKIRGRWHDSPNYVVGINVLMEAGIYANVLVESATSRAWVDGSMDEAIDRARRHLHLDDDSRDAEIREVLQQRLVHSDDGFHWPDGMRSALCWWNPAPA